MNTVVQNSFCLIYELKHYGKKRPKKNKQSEKQTMYQITLEEWIIINSNITINMINKYQRTQNKTLLDTIVSQNYKLIHYTIKYYNLAANKAVEYEDIEQEGYIGLIKAIKKFDSAKSTVFSSYAISYIRAYVLQFVKLNSNGSIAVSLHGINLLHKMKKDEKNIKDSKLKTSLGRIGASPLYLDAPIDSNSSNSKNAGEMVSDMDNRDVFSSVEFEMTWQKISLILTEPEKTVVEYFIHGFKWSEISEKINVKPQNVRTTGIRAFAKLKDRYGDELKKIII